MAETHVVSGLTAKRSELAGLLEHHQNEIQRLSADLGHIDATLKLFDPKIDLRTIRTKNYQDRSGRFRPGEAHRAILDTLRVAGQPLSSREMTERIIAARGLAMTQERIESVQKTLLTALKALEKKKVVVVAATDKFGARSWALV